MTSSHLVLSVPKIPNDFTPGFGWFKGTQLTFCRVLDGPKRPNNHTFLWVVQKCTVISHFVLGGSKVPNDFLPCFWWFNNSH